MREGKHKNLEGGCCCCCKSNCKILGKVQEKNWESSEKVWKGSEKILKKKFGKEI